MKTYLKQLSQFAVINFVVLTIIVVSLMKAKEMQKPALPAKPAAVMVVPTAKPVSGDSASSAPSVALPTTATRDFSAELPSHNNPSDCWLLIGGRYYDVTTYFGSHPGGDGELAKYCGKDATAAFASKDKSNPQDHSAAAKAMLEQYSIQ